MIICKYGCAARNLCLTSGSKVMWGEEMLNMWWEYHANVRLSQPGEAIFSAAVGLPYGFSKKKEGNMKAYKYRIYPNKEQQIFIAKHFGCCRWVYNYGLAKIKEAWEKDQTRLYPKKHIQPELPILKKQEETAFLAEVSAYALISEMDHLELAFKNFFRRCKDPKVPAKEKGYPKFKSRYDNRQSFAVWQGVKVDFEKGELRWPKFEQPIRTIFHRQFTGTVKTCTISQEPSGKYYVSILVEDGFVAPPPLPIRDETAIGVDVGLKSYLVLSDGETFERTRFFHDSQKKLKRAQQELSRKKKGSKNRQKARLKVAKIHDKISRQRSYFQHQISKKLVSSYATICVEDLDIKGMLGRQRHLSREMCDAGWGEFFRQVKYKAEWAGVNVLHAGRYEATSKTCSVCGYVKEDLDLVCREWTCPDCKTHHDRDLNAAKNIKAFAMAKVLDDGKTAGKAEKKECKKKRTTKSTVRRCASEFMTCKLSESDVEQVKAAHAMGRLFI